MDLYSCVILISVRIKLVGMYDYAASNSNKLKGFMYIIHNRYQNMHTFVLPSVYLEQANKFNLPILRITCNTYKHVLINSLTKNY